ncbi:MAG: cell division protein FtsZ [Oscillospiraceae bacterium]|nr:cell division protein FtsZ [Oscillospiraceae bacterium]MBR2977864.1 cell division protein FtsZ [Oscillospiraceae bacterium]
MSEQNNVVSIRVIGVGGAGNNVVNRMVATGVRGVDFITINTDKQDLDKIVDPSINKIQIGEKVTGGRGAGSKPEIGQKSAEESKAAIAQALEGANMVFVTAGMGGGTGTGAAPVVAGLAHDAGMLTVGVVTTPFKFEGGSRMQKAEAGIKELEDKVDALIVIPNDRLKFVTDQKITFMNAFGIADDVLKQAVESITELVNFNDRVQINLDFADVSSVMKEAGRAHMGVGRASGREKAEQAAMAAVASPLLETSINGATGVLINITGSSDLTLEEVETAANIVQEAVNPDANIIFGSTVDDSYEDEMRVTVIATGFDAKRSAKGAYSEAASEEDDFDLLTKLFERK